MKLSKVFFIITLIIFPLGEIARLEFGNGVAVTLNDILVGLFVVFFYLRTFHLRGVPQAQHHLEGGIQSDRLLKPIVFFISIAVLSLLANIKSLNLSEFFISSLYLLRWVVYSGLFFSIKSFDVSFKRIVIILLTISGTITVFGGYAQYLFYPNLRNLYYLGWDEHLYRMFSSFLDPNFAGVFFVLYFIFILGLFIQQNRNIKLALGLILILTTGAIFLTYSRSAILSFFAGLVCFLLLENKKKLILGVLFAVIFVILFLPRSFQTEGTNFFRSVSSLARFDSAKNALAIFKDSPVFGVGFNSYRYAQYRYGFIKKDNTSESSHAGAGTDNSFLFVLATTGILGFVCYLCLLRSMFKIKNKILISSLTALCISALFINSLFYPFIMEWIWILAAIYWE